MAVTQIGRGNIGTNDDGSGTTGTVVNVAYIGFIYDNIDALFTNTNGLRLNQGTSTADHLALESSSVAHGMTTVSTTDAYGVLRRANTTDGGLNIIGLTETTEAIRLSGCSVTDDTSKGASSMAPNVIIGFKKSGTSVGGVGANANLLVVSNGGGAGTKFILDGDGDSHQDVGTAWTNFDAHDDVALLTALSGAVSRRNDPLKRTFAAWLKKHRAVLERERIVTINRGRGGVFINWSRAHMLTIGAVRQLGERIQRLERMQLGGRGTTKAKPRSSRASSRRSMHA